MTFGLLILPSFLQAGGPWKVDVFDNSGDVARWPCVEAQGDVCLKWRLRYRVDPGPFATGIRNFNNDHGVALIQEILADWANVKLPHPDSSDPLQTVAIEFEYLGHVEGEEDLDAAYFESTFGRDNPPVLGYATVIFDADGSILGTGEPLFLGKAEPFLVSTSNPAYPVIMGGYIVINGYYLAENLNDPEFLAVAIKHEFGHLLNLAHSVVNTGVSLACSPNISCNDAMGIATMFPTAGSTELYTFHVDDKVGISYLYPSQAFKDSYCRVLGEVQDENGEGLQGVHVSAAAVDDPLIDIRAFQSGGRYPQGTENGQYILAGLMPGVDYEVRYEEFPSPPVDETTGECQVESTYDPCGCFCPAGFGAGVIAGPNGSAAVRCEEGGQVIRMETLKISLAEGRAVDGAASVDDGEPAEGKKGWCQLIENGKSKMENGSFGFLLLLFSLALILLIFRLHLRRVG